MSKDTNPIHNPLLIPVLVGMLTAGLEALQIDTRKQVIQIMYCDKEPSADGTPNAVVLASCPQEEVPELLQRALDTLTMADDGAKHSGKFVVDPAAGTITEANKAAPTQAEVKAFVDDLFKNLPKGPAPS